MAAALTLGRTGLLPLAKPVSRRPVVVRAGLSDVQKKVGDGTAARHQQLLAQRRPRGVALGAARTLEASGAAPRCALWTGSSFTEYGVSDCFIPSAANHGGKPSYRHIPRLVIWDGRTRT